jgi:hypothetical protein
LLQGRGKQQHNDRVSCPRRNMLTKQTPWASIWVKLPEGMALGLTNLPPMLQVLLRSLAHI